MTGVFSWPLAASLSGTCSPGCASILGESVTDCARFAALLAAGDAGRFEAALAARGDFRLDVLLRDGRQLRLTAAVADHGGDARLSGTLEDLSAEREALAELKAREELCRAVAENSPAMLWMGDENGKCVFLNQAQRDFWGVDPDDLSTFNWTATTHPDDVETLAAPFVKAMAERTSFTVSARYRRADGEYRTLRTQANPRFDRDGSFLGMTGVNIDITDQLVAEAQTRMLMGELNHRTKNILSVVQAVARQTEKHVSPGEFNRSFGSRLQGLAASNDLLLRSDWTGVELAKLVEAQLSHLSDLIGERIIVGGPPLRIAASAAQTLGMALHELSTNSLKYGALAGADGTVELSWSRTSGGGFSIAWAESGLDGVTEPPRKGFGHSVMVGMVAAALDAEVDLRFAPGGLLWQVTARSDNALA